LSESRFDTRLFETKVFVVVLVFSIIAGVNTMFARYINYWLLQAGYSVADIGTFGILATGLAYLLSSVLFIIVLHVTCGGPLLNRIARALTSLVLGSVVGYWIGGSIGAIVTSTQLGITTSISWADPLLSLPTFAVSQMLIGFAVLALSDINTKWRAALPIQELQSRRPAGLILLTVFYVIFALLDALAIPFLAVYTAYAGTISHAAFIIILAVFFGLVVSGQLVLAFGLYYGKKWGWILAVISSASSFLMSISALSASLINGQFINAQLWSLGLILGLLVSLTILFYLLSLEVRQFFGFVNPVEQPQDKPPEDKPQ
jgi:hypothetical protein